MSSCSNYQLLSLAVMLLLIRVDASSQSQPRKEDRVKSAVFVSPKFELKPGSVANKYYYNIDFPKGHIAIKDFHAQVVDEAGNSVPLYETYLHHWVVVRYYQRKGVEEFNVSDLIVKRNSGMCNGVLNQYFGLGSETRKTATYVPDPYGIEIGNPAEVPDGYEERWLVNIHAIDTRGAEDKVGCIECRCDLYNVTKDENGRKIEPDYIGGMRCCYDEMRCRVKKGFKGTKKSLYLKYTVKYIDWDASIVPVKIYIFDVTDTITWEKPQNSTATVPKHNCKIEYQVESCSGGAVANVGCTQTNKMSVSFPSGGNVIYGVAHLHVGGTGSTLHGQDGRVICSSHPIYGKGKAAGNEAGYIVGMSTCYPKPGSIKILEGETVTLISNYSNTQRHTGVMGLFYILVAESSPKPNSTLQYSTDIRRGENVILHTAVGASAVFGIALLVVAGVTCQRRKGRQEGYGSIQMEHM
ncbi:PREDICTED: uncharacterized protein LOC109238982 [Nicotiana attenuata]|uniref:Stress up-regulated Nod 19 protein n=1 Tax=Nicotiana attenuata TaxID=49451 RepID=A0A314LB22_NICAT|nr:PREDICTED: uncharacterized protein LOC109238982 [Nicotiana attenuata]OIT38772.1 hypothetical protein A4A49_13249 [Nicotiana attenuata]